MKSKIIIALLLLTITLATVTPSFAETLLAADFMQGSFSKNIDFFDYARAYATLHGMTQPPNNWHANLYMNYINVSGLHMLYAGLDNITFGGQDAFHMPLQTFLLHYKTQNSGADAIVAQTFLMLLAFNDSVASLSPDSPDINDILFSSYSMGFDVSSLGGAVPALNSKTEITPLNYSSDKLTWQWGMKYTNLTALWWRTYLTPGNPHHDPTAIAFTVYDELSFTYKLVIDPATKTATITENHVIGRMKQLFVGIIPLLWVHYNATGTYGMMGTKISNETIYDYIQNQGIKMSIVNFQTSALLNRVAYSQDSTGQNITNTDDTDTTGKITTYTNNSEKIFDTQFSTKENYKLCNYTADPTEQNSTINQANARTADSAGYARNTALFYYQIGLMKFLPLLVYNLNPAMFNRAAQTIGNMTAANYFYIISYPNYSGYRVEHDPTFTAYTAEIAAQPLLGPATGAIAAVIIIAGAAIATVAILMRRRGGRNKTATQSLHPPQPEIPPPPQP